jgi:DNA-binding response OmpR family regulator
MKVCLVEDNDVLRNVLLAALQEQGINITAVHNGEGLDALLRWQNFDAFILDLNLPGEDGLSIASRLRRAYPSCFIIMATARERIGDRVEGYEHGADVYMPKPVHIRELVAALMVRARRHSIDDAIDDRKERWLLSSSGLKACHSSQTVALTGAEHALLRSLVVAGGLPLEHWELFEVLDKDPSPQSKRVLEVHMVNLRKKMASVGIEDASLQSIRGKGYRLTAPIQLG